MILINKLCIYIIVLYFQHIFVNCFIANNDLHSYTVPFNISHFNQHNNKNIFKYVSKQVYKGCKSGSIHLKPLNSSEDGSLNRLYSNHSDSREDKHTPEISNRHIVESKILKDALISNSGIIIMVSIYLIKIFRLLLFARNLMDSLTNINPFLPPFSFIYETTSFYTKFCESFPTVMGVNIFADIPWFILNYVERYLISLITPKT